MGRLLPLLFIADLALIAVALVDCLAADRSEVRVLPRWLWVLLIVLVSPIGPVAWLAVGRPEPLAALRSGGARRPPGPDDDPDFLRRLSGRRTRPEDEELLRRLEAEFRPPDERPRPDRRRGRGDGRPGEDPPRRHPSGKDVDNDRGGEPTET